MAVIEAGRGTAEFFAKRARLLRSQETSPQINPGQLRLAWTERDQVGVHNLDAGTKRRGPRSTPRPRPRRVA